MTDQQPPANIPPQGQPYPPQGQPYPSQGQAAYPPQGQLPYPPPGYYQGPPPQKSHTVRNVLLVLIAVFVLFVGGCMALIGTAAHEAGKAIDKELANDKPTEISLGKAFDHDGYSIDAGWTLKREYDNATIKGLRVTNNEDDQNGRTALLTFHFYKGKENLAEVSCHGKELQQGESSTMDCYSTDSFPAGYDTIKVADSW